MDLLWAQQVSYSSFLLPDDEKDASTTPGPIEDPERVSLHIQIVEVLNMLGFELCNLIQSSQHQEVLKVIVNYFGPSRIDLMIRAGPNLALYTLFFVSNEIRQHNCLLY